MEVLNSSDTFSPPSREPTGWSEVTSSYFCFRKCGKSAVESRSVNDHPEPQLPIIEPERFAIFVKPDFQYSVLVPAVTGHAKRKQVGGLILPAEASFYNMVRSQVPLALTKQIAAGPLVAGINF
jgi:hypothetical protein